MFQLVRFTCDCVGTLPVNGETTIIKDCRSEGSLSMYSLKNIDKSYVRLTRDENEEFRSELEKLIYDGYGLKAIKSALGVQTAIKKLLE